MPITVTTYLPAIEELTLHPGSDELRLTWTGVDNGTLVLESRTDEGGDWTTRATVDVTAEEATIDAATLATGALITLRATVETDHVTSESVEELLTLTLPVADRAASAQPTAVVDATSPTPRSVEGSAVPARSLAGRGPDRSVNASATLARELTIQTHD